MQGSQTISWLLALVFAAAGSVNLAGPWPIRRSYKKWGYPDGFHRVTGVMELATAILLALPPVRLGRSVLGIAIMTAAAVTLVKHREFTHLPPSLALLAGLLFIAVRLIG